MIIYFILFIAVIVFTMYYLNISPFIKNKEIENDIKVDDLEISINELKNLNQYIDNGIANHTPL
jgi:hypothetical protein